MMRWTRSRLGSVGSGGAECSMCIFFFSSRRRHTRLTCDWSSDVCSSDLIEENALDQRFTLINASAPPHGRHERLPAARFPERAVPRPRADPGWSLTACMAFEHRVGPGDALRSEERRVGKEWRSWLLAVY